MNFTRHLSSLSGSPATRGAGWSVHPRVATLFRWLAYQIESPAERARRDRREQLRRQAAELRGSA